MALGARQRLSSARELGRLVLDVSEDLTGETVCDRFSRAFLVPREGYVNDVGERRQKISQRELVLLKQKYGVSVQALVARMEDLGIITGSHAGRIFRRLRTPANGEEPGEPLPREQPRRFERMFEHARAEELITRRRAAELLGREPSAHAEPVPA
jgi:Zn-dependent peptidase ImmA (M78 family)